MRHVTLDHLPYSEGFVSSFGDSAGGVFSEFWNAPSSALSLSSVVSRLNLFWVVKFFDGTFFVGVVNVLFFASLKGECGIPFEMTGGEEIELVVSEFELPRPPVDFFNRANMAVFTAFFLSA